MQHRYDPVGSPTAHWLEAAGVPLPLQRQYQYEEHGQLSYLYDQMRGSTRLLHDVLGRLRTAALPRGETHFHDFDPNGDKTVRSAFEAKRCPYRSARFASIHQLEFGSGYMV
jgi:hypothetical protein